MGENAPGAIHDPTVAYWGLRKQINGFLLIQLFHDITKQIIVQNSLLYSGDDNAIRLLEKSVDNLSIHGFIVTGFVVGMCAF